MATPTTFEDGNDGACNVVHCTLREALSFPIQTINLLHGTYELTMQQPLILSGVRTINGAGATIDGNGASRVLFLQETTNATINDVTITGGNATGNAPQGGGIYVQNPSTLQLNRSTVAGNRADTQGGGIFTESSGLVEIIDSTISGNAAGPVGGGGQGAGIYAGANPNVTNVRLFNTTISGNEIPGIRALGAGVAALGALELVHTTIAGNVSSDSGLDVNSVAGVPAPPALTISNTIVASDSGPACVIVGRTIAGGYSLDDDGTCGFSRVGDRPGVNPLLGPLQNNGGPTNTMALLAGSPAIGGAQSGDLRRNRPARRRSAAAGHLRHRRVRVRPAASTATATASAPAGRSAAAAGARQERERDRQERDGADQAAGQGAEVPAAARG